MKQVATYLVRVTVRSDDESVKPLTVEDVEITAKFAITNVIAKQNGGRDQATFEVNASAERADA